MTKRTDIHRPSAINPEEYVLIALLTQRDAESGDLGACEFLRAEREALNRHMRQTGGKYSDHGHGGNCHVCGAWCVDEAVFWHEPTNTYIRTGFDCATKLDMGDARKFRKFRDDAKQAEHYVAGKAKAKATLEEKGLGRAWEIREDVPSLMHGSHHSDKVLSLAGVPVPSNRLDDEEPVYDYTDDEAVEVKREELAEQVRPYVEGLSYFGAGRVVGAMFTISDIVGKLVRYGSISDKQAAFLKRLVEDVDGGIRAKDEERAEEEAKAEDAPEGRVEVEGVVLSTRVQNGYAYNSVEYKMLVKDDRGFKVWSTVPQSLVFDLQENHNGHRHDALDDLKGRRVSFTATLQPKADDPKFAIAKRPTKAEMIEEE